MVRQKGVRVLKFHSLKLDEIKNYFPGAFVSLENDKPTGRQINLQPISSYYKHVLAKKVHKNNISC